MGFFSRDDDGSDAEQAQAQAPQDAPAAIENAQPAEAPHADSYRSGSLAGLQ